MEPLEHPNTAFNAPPQTQSKRGRFHVIGPRGKDRDRMVLQLETLGYVCEMSDTLDAAHTAQRVVEARRADDLLRDRSRGKPRR